MRDVSLCNAGSCVCEGRGFNFHGGNIRHKGNACAKNRGRGAANGAHGTHGTYGTNGTYGIHGTYGTNGTYGTHGNYGTNGTYGTHGTNGTYVTHGAERPYQLHGSAGAVSGGLVVCRPRKQACGYRRR